MIQESWAVFGKILMTLTLMLTVGSAGPVSPENDEHEHLRLGTVICFICTLPCPSR